MLVLLVTIFYAIYAFGVVFTVCELFQRLTDGFDEINDVIDQLKWYQFPDEIQKMLPTLLIIVQKPVVIKCFGSISCCRETFKEVSFYSTNGLILKIVCQLCTYEYIEFV